ncbi:hypothetical protein I4U23_016517 [Adineta vaga]|nr:hypothetical protein I4U23_016517 [Adineta vaga]
MGGGTAFCPSFERTRQFPTAYDAIIISDGDFTDNISRLAFQEQCKTVFFVAPPWSPVGIEERHAAIISSCVHPNVPYVGIASDRYTQLDTIIEGFLREHHSYVHLPGYFKIGMYALPSFLLAPSQMIQLFNNCHSQGEIQLQSLTKKILGIFRYLEETAKLNFQRCIRGEEFRNLMSLVVPLTKASQAYLEDSTASQQLYGYLNKIMNTFSAEYRKLIKQVDNDLNAKVELRRFWEEALSFNEKGLIIEENDKKYGPAIGYLNVRLDNLTCQVEKLADALQQLRTLYCPDDFHLLSMIFDLLCMCEIEDQPSPDDTIDLLSILRQLPCCLQQYQYLRGVPRSSVWTLQPLAAIRLAWIMDVTQRPFPNFIIKALPTLLDSNKILTNLDHDDNRSVFWMKILRELAPKIKLSSEKLETINQILTIRALKGFLQRARGHTIDYQRSIYRDALPFIDTDEPMAWCIFVNSNFDRVDSHTGQVLRKNTFVTNPNEVEKWYRINLTTSGATVRPRYLTLLNYPNLPDGAIELYNNGIRKDVDIFRDQLLELYSNVHTSNQINAHIYTIRDRMKTIPYVQWDNETLIREVVSQTKAECQGATLPMELANVVVTKKVMIDYCLEHCNDRFVVGVVRGLHEYYQVDSQASASGISPIDYALECGQKALDTTTDTLILPFNRIDRPGVREYLERQRKKFCRVLRSVKSPPYLQSVSAMIEQAKRTATNDEMLGLAVLETIPVTTTEEKTAHTRSHVALDRNFFTCPITLDIMEDPVITTPCGHMFEKDAFENYLRRVGNTCPVCRTAVMNIIPSYSFKNVIEAWLAQQEE